MSIAVSAITAISTFGCSTAAPLQPATAGGEPPPRTTRALSVAAVAHTPCRERDLPQPFDVDFHDDLPRRLRVSNEARGRGYRFGQLGYAILRESACARYTVEVAIPLPADASGTTTGQEYLRLGHALGLLLLPSGDGPTLRSVAQDLRLSPNEPFVYGWMTEISEDESFSLRLEPRGSGGRLMLVYRIGL